MTTPARPFDAVDDLISQGIVTHLANATVQTQPGGPAWAALYERTQPGEGTPFADVATVAAHTIALHINSALGDVVEGAQVVVSTSAWPAGQLCRITTAVEPDESGWATFAVVPLA